MTLEAGLRATAEHVVKESHTAIAMGSGDVAVLATPQVLAWCEQATVDSIAAALAETESAVGMRVRLDHVRATPVGASVPVEAELSRVEGRRLTFEVRAADARGEIATGQVIRVIVDRDRFLERASSD